MPEIEYQENEPKSRKEVNVQKFINTDRVEKLMTVLVRACKFIESRCFEVHIKIPICNHKCHTDIIINYLKNLMCG